MNLIKQILGFSSEHPKSTSTLRERTVCKIVFIGSNPIGGSNLIKEGQVHLKATGLLRVVESVHQLEPFLKLDYTPPLVFG